MDERKLIRRVVTAACAVAVLTTPFVRSAVDSDASWIAGTAVLVVLGLTLLALGDRRVSLRAVVGTMAVVFWAMTVASFWQATAALVRGDEVVAYGSGPLWLAAVVGPLVFLAFPVERALGFVAAGAVAYPLVFVIGTGRAAGALLLTSGLWFQAVATVLVVLATLVVARLAHRSAVEQTEAEALRQRAASERHELAAAQRRRAAVFSRTATELRRPMAELTDAVAGLGRAPSSDVRRAAERVATISTAVLDRIVASLDSLVASASLGRSQDEVAQVGDADDGRDADQRVDPAGLAIAAVVVLVVVLDALLAARQFQGIPPDTVAVGLAGSRMLLVVFVGAAMVAAHGPGRLGWVAVPGLLLVHPMVLWGTAGGAISSSLVAALVPPWRNALLSATFVLLLSVVIDRRVRARDVAQWRAATDAAGSRELRVRQSAAARTYAEAAHELKNPLTVIAAGARTLWRGPPLPQPRTAQLRDAVVRSTARLDDRLREMRAVAGIPDDAASVATPAATDVRHALEAAVAALDVAARASSIELDLRCDDAQVVIVHDQLDHVMENLLANALVYGAPGGPVRVEARVAAHEVRVEVANLGGSLTREQAGHVFEPYWRASDGQDHPSGSGLGLAIVDRLVRGWNGTRWCSVADGWTRMGFSIPLTGSGAMGRAADHDRSLAPRDAARR